MQLQILLTNKNNMASKKAYPLRINENLLKAIEKWASDEFRSTNGQLEWMIHKCLKEAKRLPKDYESE